MSNPAPIPRPVPQPNPAQSRTRARQTRRTRAVAGALVAGALVTSVGATAILAWPGSDSAQASETSSQQTNGLGASVSAGSTTTTHATSKGS